MISLITSLPESEKVADLVKRIRTARMKVFGIGGPCNDNPLHFDQHQREWIRNLAEHILGDPVEELLTEEELAEVYNG